MVPPAALIKGVQPSSETERKNLAGLEHRVHQRASGEDDRNLQDDHQNREPVTLSILLVCHQYTFHARTVRFCPHMAMRNRSANRLSERQDFPSDIAETPNSRTRGCICRAGPVRGLGGY